MSTGKPVRRLPFDPAEEVRLRRRVMANHLGSTVLVEAGDLEVEGQLVSMTANALHVAPTTVEEVEKRGALVPVPIHAITMVYFYADPEDPPPTERGSNQ